MRTQLIWIGIGVSMVCGVSKAGDLTPPPGPVAPTMLTLDTVEPRTPITQADLPLTIADEGSYFLAENVFPTALNQPFMIRIVSDNVTLDLRGFTILGATEVTTSLIGVEVSAGSQGVTIHDGNISGVLNEGVNAEAGAEVTLRGLNLTGCGTGVFLDSGSLVESCRASSCTLSGFLSETGGNTFVNCQAVSNGQSGFAFRDGDSAHGCSAYENGVDGFQGNVHTVLIGCAARLNGRDGFLAGFASTVSGCTSTGNGRRGFSVSACAVTGCVAVSNTDDGFNSFSSGAAYSECHANSNGGGGFGGAGGDSFRGCTAVGNTLSGIDTGGSSTVTGCTARSNGGDGFVLGSGDVTESSSASNNSGHGFNVSGATVSGCSANNNDTSGFRLASVSTLTDCVARQNGFGGLGYGFLVEGSSNMIARCRANNNDDGEFQNNGGGSNRIGTLRTSLTTAGPWDNLDF